MHTQNKSAAAGHTQWTMTTGKHRIEVRTSPQSSYAFSLADDANARLIAAAPTMLAALISAQEDLADLGQLSAETIAMFAPAIHAATGGVK